MWHAIVFGSLSVPTSQSFDPGKNTFDPSKVSMPVREATFVTNREAVYIRVVLLVSKYDEVPQ